MFELRRFVDGEKGERWAVVLRDEHGTRRASAVWTTREQGERSLERWQALEAAQADLEETVHQVTRRRDPMAMLLDAILAGEDD
jgi:hypothetical protein